MEFLIPRMILTYWKTFIAIIVAVGVSLSVAPTQACPLATPNSLSPSLQAYSDQDQPLVTGKPSDRKPAGTYAKLLGI